MFILKMIIKVHWLHVNSFCTPKPNTLEFGISNDGCMSTEINTVVMQLGKAWNYC